MMRVLSDIYPPEIKPVRDGWYLSSPTDKKQVSPFWSLRYWNGEDWCTAWGETYQLQEMWSWRGLAFCPYTAIATTHTDVSIASQRVYEIEGVFVPGATCC